MYKSLLFLLLIFWANSVCSQNIEAGFYSVAGSKGQLPTWLWANQLGVYDPYSSSVQNFQLLAAYKTSPEKSDFVFEGQAQLNAILADDNAFRFTELYGGINWKFLQLKMGAFSEKEAYMGLSASNGNLAYSRNARPHPRIRAGFNRYVPIIKNWLSLYGFWEEGLLNDKRYVADTHLHHKAFYLRVGNTKTIQLTGGLEHYVMWWGTHPTVGELPGWEDYFKYVSGSSGGENALATDQANVLGNGYGTYQFKIEKEWDAFKTSLYLSHPFEDRSGLEWQNWRDNLYGIHFQFHKENPLIEGLVLEYYHTKHQSGDYHLAPQANGNNSGRGLDNYYNHSVYRSGVSYHQMAMASPLMAPLVLDEGISKGFENNSISGFHLGANGYLSSHLYWKGMLTHTSNFGRKKTGGAYAWEPAKNQVASLISLQWQFHKRPLVLAGSFAADRGDLFDEEQTTRLGYMFSLTWKIN